MRTSSGSTWYGDNMDRISWASEGYDEANTIGIIEKDLQSFMDAVADNPPVDLELTLTRATEEAETAALPLQVGP